MGGRRLDAHLVEQIGELDPLPGHVGDPPTGHALEVLREHGLREPVPEVGEVEHGRSVHRAVDREPVLGLAPLRQRPGDGVDAEPARGREQAGETGAVVERDGPEHGLHAGLHLGSPEDAGGAEAEHPEQGATPHRPVLRRVRHLGRCAGVHGDEGTGAAESLDGVPGVRRRAYGCAGGDLGA